MPSRATAGCICAASHAYGSHSRLLQQSASRRTLCQLRVFACGGGDIDTRCLERGINVFRMLHDAMQLLSSSQRLPDTCPFYKDRLILDLDSVSSLPDNPVQVTHTNTHARTHTSTYAHKHVRTHAHTYTHTSLVTTPCRQTSCGTCMPFDVCSL